MEALLSRTRATTTAAAKGHVRVLHGAWDCSLGSTVVEESCVVHLDKLIEMPPQTSTALKSPHWFSGPKCKERKLGCLVCKKPSPQAGQECWVTESRRSLVVGSSLNRRDSRISPSSIHQSGRPAVPLSIHPVPRRIGLFSCSFHTWDSESQDLSEEFASPSIHRILSSACVDLCFSWLQLSFPLIVC